MKISLKTVFFLIFLFSASSCKKEIDLFGKEQTTLPNYGNVDLSAIFHHQDNKLQNEDSITNVLKEYYTKIWEKEDLSGGLLIAKGDHIIFERYRGFGRSNNTLPIDKDTPMHVASVSKTLTAMATMKLVEAGKINLNDHLTKFFPGFPYPEVTVLNLLTQRSGLPKYEYFIEKIPQTAAELSKPYLSNQDILNLLVKYKPELARAVNSGFMYCNTNFALLALIIEKTTKTHFPDAMQQIIFTPLKMEHTKIFQEKDIATSSQSFYYRGNRLYPLDHLDLIYGDKNVYTTPRDLLNFSKAMFSKNFLRADLMDMIFAPYSNERRGVNNYGIGFRMKLFDNGEKLTYHNGWWHGSNAVFAHLLKSNVTIVAIGNKYSQRVYSALSLSGLFEDFPAEKDRLMHILEKDTVTGKDSLKENSDSYTE